MPAPLFHREYAITFGTLRISGLRVAFSVKKSLSKTPNTCEVKIYNLNHDSRAQLQSKGTRFVLEGGYTDNIGVLFSGTSRTVDHTRDGADWVTSIKSGDGETVSQYKRFINSYARGTPIAQVIRDAVSALAINPGNLSAALAQPFRGGVTTFAHGFTAHGNAVDILAQLLKSAGFTMSIQNGALQVLKGGTAVQQASSIALSVSTGLIGTPEHAAPADATKSPRIKVTSLMQPQIICGGLVAIQSLNVNGVFRAENVEHAGDTHAKEWFTKMELLKAENYVVLP